MLFFAALTVAIVLGLFALDLILRRALRVLAYYFPSEVAGPDGWLIDTRSQKGVFDI